MHSNTILAAVAVLLTLGAASPTLNVASSIEKRECYNGPVVVYARGTDPNYNGDPTQPDPTPTDPLLASIASSGIPKASVTALSYPATGTGNFPNYQTSWGTGIDELQGLIKYLVDSCGETQIVLLGYSQGASVVTGTIAGGQGRPALTGKYLSAIAGGVAIADPSFVINLSPLDDQSTNTESNGSFQDGDVQTNLNSMLKAKFRSFCSAGDEFCANAGSSGGSIHGNAESTWFNDAVDFLQGLNL